MKTLVVKDGVIRTNKGYVKVGEAFTVVSDAEAKRLISSGVAAEYIENAEIISDLGGGKPAEGKAGSGSAEQDDSVDGTEEEVIADLVLVKGIGAASAKKLYEVGIRSVEAVQSIEPVALADVLSITPEKAEAIVADAKTIQVEDED